ncbi:MAG: hypothetical protein AEth_00657 [Candidatus Argoarchaeum ethanivorans]|uniref:Metalloenzyme domain-containing protein n=1 Tax=Candidatus Argoarchaeum ethanivorans TaxID=2608793 RepID=A0A8B3S3V3_9EURY|nr:MAG: hypothetical protein AEth_00657 [Candidatus Argoarchaeum ethanivorans]
MRNIHKILITLFIINCTAASASVPPSQGAVLFIADGLGSHYIYPELMAETHDGKKLQNTPCPNITAGGLRVLYVKAPVPKTGPGHSVIVTGNSKATTETIPETTTLFDVLRSSEEFLILGVMERGSSSNMREKQDAVLYARSNSIRSPIFEIQHKNAPSEILKIMEQRCSMMPEYVNNTAGATRYCMYNRFAIETAEKIVKTMIQEYPSKRFLLIVNVGGLESAGHYAGFSTYSEVIKGLDVDLYSFKKLCRDNHIVFLFTSDHGISFRTVDSRGGNAGSDYVKKTESLYIPLVINAENVKTGILKGEHGQEDIAPTLLGILDIANTLDVDGKALPIKNYANIYATTDADYVQLYQGNSLVDNQTGKKVVFKYLEGTYRLRFVKGNTTIEQNTSLEGDIMLNVNVPDTTKTTKTTPPTVKRTSTNHATRYAAGMILILFVNIIGIMLIRRIKD